MPYISEMMPDPRLSNIAVSIKGTWISEKRELRWDFNNSVEEKHKGKLHITIPIVDLGNVYEYELTIVNDVFYIVIDGKKRKIVSLSDKEFSYATEKGVIILQKEQLKK
ncbi:MAG TPA: hypothetical protein VGO09_00835 [Flavisolibacter sp.]|jgi:hypothetical protein|nr:hypothetical protein [Flavisolibacter sp.]